MASELERSGAVEAHARDVVVVGLARGGVEVADEVAARLGAPLDALAVRKVGHPWQPEYGIGAVAPGGIHYIRAHDGLTEAEVAEVVRAADEKAAALDTSLHARYSPPPVVGKTCVLVDDGLATGGTMIAAARWATAQRARRVVVAVPVGAAATIRSIGGDPNVDGVVCLAAPLDFMAVGFWYEDFHQISDDDVTAILEARRSGALERHAVEIELDGTRLAADVTNPVHAIGWVVFAHGSGSSRTSPRNVAVAETLNRAGIATMLFDLLTPAEQLDRRNVFDVELLGRRLVAATGWLVGRPEAHDLPVAYFGASTGAAAALIAAGELGEAITAVVSRGGRPDLAADRLAEVRAPTLLIVGGADETVLELNREAAARLSCPHELAVVPGATHLFEEPGALEQVASLAAAWFSTHLVV